MQSDYEPITDFTDSASAPALVTRWPDGDVHPRRVVVHDRYRAGLCQDAAQRARPSGLTDDPRLKFGAGVQPRRFARRLHRGFVSMEHGNCLGHVDGARIRRDADQVARQCRRIVVARSRGTSCSPRSSRAPPLHMGLVTATEDRRDARQIYLTGPRARHGAFFLSIARSRLGPRRRDGKTRDLGSVAGCCRSTEVPAGQPVGPAGSVPPPRRGPPTRDWMCTSPREVDGLSHLWRQRFPDGTPQPLTSGPTTEEARCGGCAGRTIAGDLDRHAARARCGCIRRQASGCCLRRVTHRIHDSRRTGHGCITCCAERRRLASSN